ncbi:hypothetical protein [Streptomyces genisteinicus]|uniref:Roadblock/LAMTOR2 domain-containing protein n=1 Tax=Streptomyces genisteinicus TaxID=2768068 RepID=A0A7H0HSZ1_9ACTN|nr:hypothetical protein [Streptomyces genisteinicus]QNP63657.1 hypothetical protein IAG43_12415 [Streptomyces genisteinicus]
MPGIDECLLQAMVVPGARGAAIVDWTSGLALGAIGETPGGDVETTAAETAELARMAAEYPSFAPDATGPAGPGGPGNPEPGTGARGIKGLPVEDLIVTTRDGYHVIRFVETTFDSSVFLHLWLDRDTGNLALARLRMADIAERLVLG